MIRAAMFALGTLVTLAPPLRAQGSHLGLLAGPTAATNRGDYVAGTSGLELGFSLLAVLDREFSRVWGVQVGVGWVQKGGRKLRFSGQTSSHGFQTQYVDFPVSVFAKIHLANGRLALRPHAGIAVGLAMACQYKPGDQFEFEEDCGATTPGGELEAVEVSAPLGAALTVEFPGGSKFTILDVGLQLGLTNVLSGAAAVGQSAANTVWSFRFGLLAPLY